MCGIAGIIDFRGRRIDEALLARFNACLRHRGPDDCGVFARHADGFSVGLAHTRLAVIDPTPEGHQPMLDAGGRHVITYNGELYNYRALREQLPAPCRTQSDTEVVLEAFAAWGPEALRRFDGMWALAFVDLVRRSGHLSRDPFGIKPLVYAIHGDRLIFASELNAIRMVPDIPLDIDRDALDIYLNLGFIPHPHTIYRQIRKLPPGHMLRFDAQGVREPERYGLADSQNQSPCSVSVQSETGNRKSQITCYPEAVEEARRLTMAAVERQRVADVPLGAFLSGGLDSSIVVSCLAQNSAQPVKTFSIGYADHGRYDETSYARLVADRFHTEHHEFRLTFRDVLDTIEPALRHLGEPFADSSLLPTMLVSRHTRQHVTVALSGDGGDELFGGYWRYLAHGYLDRYQRIPGIVRDLLIDPLLGAILEWTPTARSSRWLDRLRQLKKLMRAASKADPLARHLAWSRWLRPAELAALMGADRAATSMTRLQDAYRSAAEGRMPEQGQRFSLQHVLNADLAIGLPADMLHKVDIASMMHSLEVRVPLLAPDLVDYVARLPLEYKIDRGTGKRILRDAFREVLPPGILKRSKMGFEVPVGEWLRRELREMYMSVVTSSTLQDLGIEPRAAGRLFKAHLNRREDYADALWSLLVLSHWHNTSRRTPTSGYPSPIP